VRGRGGGRLGRTVAWSAAVVLAGLAGAAVAAVLAGRAGLFAPTVGTPATPSATPSPSLTTPSPSATAEPTSSRTPPPTRALGCVLSRTQGDFDGDGAVDVAIVHYPEPRTGCAQDPLAGPFPYHVAVRFGSGQEVDAVPDGCLTLCRGRTALDLDGDGRDELAVLVEQGASTSFISFFRVGPDGVGAIPVAPPGAPGFDAGAPAVFALGGSVMHFDYLTCGEEEGGPVLVATATVLAYPEMEYRTRDVTFRFDGTALVPLRTGRRVIPASDVPAPATPVPLGDPCPGLEW
jgi:hypothetical protein